MVRLTAIPSFRDASCCSVEVVNGAAGLRGAVFCSRLRTPNPPKASAEASASTAAWSERFPWNSAVNPEPFGAAKRPSMRKSMSETNCSMARSRSTIMRTATDCTRPALSPVRTFFQRTGESSKPTSRSSTRRACWALTRFMSMWRGLSTAFKMAVLVIS